MKPLLMIDPGHGGSDPGAVGNGLREKDLTLQISLYQYERFQQLGVPVALTRDTDKSLDPVERTAIVRNSGARYCISNHINAGGGCGVEAIHSIDSDGELALRLAQAVVSAGQTFRRVFSRTLPNNPKRDYYYMHRDTGSVETVIMEYGFIDHAEDVAKIQANWQKYAEAVVQAFCGYIGHPYQPPGKPEKPVEHWAKADHDELRALGLLLNDHPDLDAPATKGFVIELVNRIRKQGAPQPPAPEPPKQPEPPKEPAPEPPTQPPTPEPEPPQPAPQPKAWEEVERLAAEASVYIEVGMKPGSGVLIPGGYILTAKHVATTETLRVQTKDGTWHDAQLVATHPHKDVDLAICRVETIRKQPLTVSRQPVQPGGQLLAVANGGRVKWEVKTGKMLRMKSGQYQPWEFESTIQAESGDSGSGVLNEYGELCGILVQKGAVIANVGGVMQLVPGSEVVSLSHPLVADWLKQYLK